MIAILLAAGKGKRMNRTECSKPMCLVGGKHLIRYSIDALLFSGISDIHIIYSINSTDVLKLKDAYPELSFHFQKNVTGSLSSFYFASSFCNGPFILMDADIIVEPNQLKMMIASIKKSPTTYAYFAAIRKKSFNAVCSVAVSNNNNVLLYDKNGIPSEMGGKHLPGGMIYVWINNPFAAISSFLIKSHSMSAFLKYATEQFTIKAMYIDELWDVDTEEDIIRTEQYFGEKQQCKKNNYKAVAVDLDGTLLKTDKRVSDFTCNIINCVKDRGVKTVISTSRRFQTAKPYYNNLNFDAISCAGGALVVCGDKVISINSFPESDGIRLLNIAKIINSKIKYSILTTDNFFTSDAYESAVKIEENYRNVTGEWLRILFYLPNKEFVEELLKKNIGSNLKIRKTLTS